MTKTQEDRSEMKKGEIHKTSDTEATMFATYVIGWIMRAYTFQ